MSQDVRGYPFLDANGFGSITDDPVELVCGNGHQGIAPGKQPHPWPRHPCDLEVGDLGYAQTSAIGHAHCRLVLDARSSPQELQDLLLAEHGWKLLCLSHHRDAPAHLWAIERHAKEEPQCGDRAVYGRRLCTFLALMHLIPAQIFARCRGWRAAEER